MRVLLDTHLFLWAFLQPTKLSREAKRLIENSDVHISAASIWEISIKSSLGKLKVKPIVMLDAIKPAGFKEGLIK